MRYLLILIPTLLMSCGRDKATTRIDANFAEFLTTIPNQPLPVELECGLPDETKFSEDFKAFYEFIPKSTDRILGAIESNSDDYKLVIFGQTGDDIYPIIFSFDNKGEVRDSLFLILHGCGGADGDQIPDSFVSIRKDLTIELTDTTRFIHTPENRSGYVVDSLQVTNMLFKLDKNGRFMKQ
jgi:hypothetical protein